MIADKLEAGMELESVWRFVDENDHRRMMLRRMFYIRRSEPAQDEHIGDSFSLGSVVD